MVVLSVGVVFVRDDPHKFAAFLIADFLFFFAVLMGAIADAFGILRKHLHEKRRVLPETLNEAKFLSELRHRVKKKEGD